MNQYPVKSDIENLGDDVINVPKLIQPVTIRATQRIHPSRNPQRRPNAVRLRLSSQSPILFPCRNLKQTFYCHLQALTYF